VFLYVCIVIVLLYFGVRLKVEIQFSEVGNYRNRL